MRVIAYFERSASEIQVLETPQTKKTLPKPDTCIGYCVARFECSLSVTYDSYRCDYDLGSYRPFVVLWGLVEVFRGLDRWMGVGLLIVCGSVVS